MYSHKFIIALILEGSCIIENSWVKNTLWM